MIKSYFPHSQTICMVDTDGRAGAALMCIEHGLGRDQRCLCKDHTRPGDVGEIFEITEDCELHRWAFMRPSLKREPKPEPLRTRWPFYYLRCAGSSVPALIRLSEVASIGPLVEIPPHTKLSFNGREHPVPTSIRIVQMRQESANWAVYPEEAAKLESAILAWLEDGAPD